MKRLLLITLMLALGLTGFSQTKTWNPGGVAPFWEWPSNWTPSGVPVNTDNVVIPDGEGYKVLLGTSGVCRNLTIGADVILDIASGVGGAILTYYGDVYVEGILKVGSHASIMKYEPLTSIVVTSNANDGPYTLRRAIEYIADGGTITFNLPTGDEDISLTGSEIVIEKSLTIDGGNTAGSGLSVSGDGTHRIFYIPTSAGGKTIEFNNMEINEGHGIGIGGGGILCMAGTLIVDSVSFNANETTNTGVDGGGIHVNNSTCTITNSTFDGNISGNEGGGMYAESSTVTITGCTFSNNQAASIGGGIYTSGGNLSIINSTYAENSALGNGGAIYAAGPVNMKFTTVHGNSVLGGNGGGVFLNNAATLTIKNCMLGGNATLNRGVGADFSRDDDSSVTDDGHNIVEDSDNYNWTAPGDITGQQDDLFGTGTDSQTLAYNGGPTQTLKIEAGSVAHGAGAADVTTDQRGLSRIDPPTIGAFESFEVGDLYGGGVVFWVDTNVEHGLVCALFRTSNERWNNGTNVTTGATETAIGTGQANTNTIITVQGAGNYAATICDNHATGGYGDWFLPSKDELYEMYLNIAVINATLHSNGQTLTQTTYSSTEYDQNNAWTQAWSGSPVQNVSNKITNWAVRAVRAF